MQKSCRLSTDLGQSIYEHVEERFFDSPPIGAQLQIRSEVGKHDIFQNMLSRRMISEYCMIDFITSCNYHYAQSCVLFSDASTTLEEVVSKLFRQIDATN